MNEATARILITIENTKLKIKLNHEMNMARLKRITNSIGKGEEG